MNQAFHLYRLQQIDTQITQVEAALAEVNRLLNGDESVRQAQALLDVNEKALVKARQALKQAEFLVRDQNTKIEQTEATLYSGKVKNPKELQDLQKDVASLKKHFAQLEDRQLEAMMGVEEAERSVQEARQVLVQAQAAFSEKSAGWSGQREQFTKTRDRLLAERTPALSLITPDSLNVYNRLRPRKSGVAVTVIRDGSCAVCGASIRPSEMQEARASTVLVFCASCGRILYTG